MAKLEPSWMDAAWPWVVNLGLMTGGILLLSAGVVLGYMLLKRLRSRNLPGGG